MGVLVLINVLLLIFLKTLVKEAIYWNPYLKQECILHFCFFVQLMCDYFTWDKYQQIYEKEFKLRIGLNKKLENKEEIDEDQIIEESAY